MNKRKLLQYLRLLGIPSRPKLDKLVKVALNDSKAAVTVERITSDNLKIGSGIKQGD